MLGLNNEQWKNVRNSLEYYKYAEGEKDTKSYNEFTVGKAFNEIRFHLEENHQGGASYGVLAIEPAAKAFAKWLGKELKDIVNDDFTFHDALDNLHSIIDNEYKENWVKPALSVIKKAKQYL